MFTQTLICNDKVNDGAYFAIETNFPEGTIANLGDAEGSTGIAWAFLQPAFTGYPRTLSRALQARGFIEEVIGAYSVSGNVIQGGGIDQYGNSSAIMNFEIAAQGMGAKYVLDGTDTCAAMFNPEGDAGDVEMWELICPMIYLSRRIKAEHGRRRAPPRRLELRVAAGGLDDTRSGSSRTSARRGSSASRGCSAAIPARRPTSTTSAATTSSSAPKRARPTRSPTASCDDPALMAIEGERNYKQDNFTTAGAVRRGRPLPLGDEGRGRPRRPAAAARRGGRARHRRGPPARRASPSPSTRVADRDGGARGGGSSARGPAREWWAPSASGCWPAT